MKRRCSTPSPLTNEDYWLGTRLRRLIAKERHFCGWKMASSKLQSRVRVSCGLEGFYVYRIARSPVAFYPIVVRVSIGSWTRQYFRFDAVRDEWACGRIARDFGIMHGAIISYGSGCSRCCCNIRDINAGLYNPEDRRSCLPGLFGLGCFPGVGLRSIAGRGEACIR